MREDIDIGIVRDLQERRESVVANLSPAAKHRAFPNCYRRPVVVAKETVITVDCKTGARTITTPEDKPFALKTAPRLPPVRPRMESRKADKILRAVCRAWGVSHDDLISAQRNQRVSRPRFAAYHFMRHILNWSLPQVGRPLANRDHTTILSGLRRAEWLLVNDADWRQRYDAALAELESAGEP